MPPSFRVMRCWCWLISLWLQCPVGHLKEVMDLFSLTALEICEGQQMDMEFERRNDVKGGGIFGNDSSERHLFCWLRA